MLAESLSIVLRTLMKKQGITVTELARRTGVPQPVVHRMAAGESDNPKIASLSPLAKFFNVNISQLIGDEPLTAVHVTAHESMLYRHWQRLPCLTWAEVAVYATQQLLPTVNRYVASDCPVSTQAFATTMENTTMLPQFPEETVLIFEPMQKAQHQDFVLVAVPGDAVSVQFKQLLCDAETCYLKPLNIDFQIKELTTAYHILGTLVQAVMEYRHNAKI